MIIYDNIWYYILIYDNKQEFLDLRLKYMIMIKKMIFIYYYILKMLLKYYYN